VGNKGEKMAIRPLILHAHDGWWWWRVRKEEGREEEGKERRKGRKGRHGWDCFDERWRFDERRSSTGTQRGLVPDQDSP
jgi:hypothetical protein